MPSFRPGLTAGLLLCSALTGHAESATETAPAVSKQVTAEPTYDFSKASSLPYEMPPFDQLSNGDFEPGFQAGLTEQRAEIDAIAHNPAPPTFDNTIVALERSGQTLTRVSEWFNNLTSSNTNDALDAIQVAVAPKLAAHQDAIFLDPLLYGRVKALYEARATLGLDAEDLRLLVRYHTMFVRAGAELSSADQERLKAINQELSSLTPEFQQTLLKTSNAHAVVVDSAAELDGLPPERIAAAAKAAEAKGLSGQWLIALQNTTRQSVLAELKDRKLREKIYRASITRGIGNPDDTTELITHMARLRARQAKLLGYPNYAAFVLDDTGAKTPAAVNKTLHDLALPAEANARRTAADLQQLIDAEARAAHTKPFKLQPWDWEYYAGKLRKARFDYDEAEARPYFELEHVLKDGVFFAAHELYGLSFKERPDLPVYQKDVRTFEIFNADGSPLGLIMLDYFARPNKQGGAWMTNYIDQSALFKRRAVVVNNLNIPKPGEGQPVLLNFDFVTTMFHEFGHALHGLFSDTRYPLLSGTNVALDFVEYPSQYNEMWASDPRVLANYARHYQTGQALPGSLADKLLAVQRFDQSFDTTEYLAAAILDQAWHQIDESQAPVAKDLMHFEAAALKKAGVDFAAVPPRYHTPFFAHIWGGGYSAGYYAYIWSAVLGADTKDWMRSHGSLVRANGDFLRAKVLSRGGTADAAELFHDFFGGAPDVMPLLVERGLVAQRGSGGTTAIRQDKEIRSR